MPVNLSEVSFSNIKKYIIRNKTGSPVSIGDLKIVLNPSGSPGSSIDLLGKDNFNKKSLRTFSEVHESKDLDLMISLGLIEVEIDSIVLESGENFKSATSGAIDDITVRTDTKSVNWTVITNDWTSEIIDIDLDLGNIGNKTSIILGFFSGINSVDASLGVSANKTVAPPSLSNYKTSNPFIWGEKVLGYSAPSYLKLYEDYNEAELNFESSAPLHNKFPYPGTTYIQKLGVAPTVTDGFKYSHSGYGILVGYYSIGSSGPFGIAKTQLVTAWLIQDGLNTICRFRFNVYDIENLPDATVEMTVVAYY